jgi:hypothetical protein
MKCRKRNRRFTVLPKVKDGTMAVELRTVNEEGIARSAILLSVVEDVVGLKVFEN